MKHWSIMVAAVFSWHCAVPVELEFEADFAPKVVVNAEFTPDSIWTVLLSRSVAYTDSVDWDQQVLTNASVRIHDPQRFVKSLTHMGQGIYQSSFEHTPIADTRYTIVVTTPGLPEARASSMARSVEAALVDIREFSSTDTTKRSFRVRIRIEDQPGQDYYSLDLDHLQPLCDEEGRSRINQVEGGGTRYRFVRFDSDFSEMRETVADVNDPSLLPTAEGGDYYGEAYFSDRSFEGDSKLIELTMNLPYYDALAPHIRISVANWSKELWSYAEYRILVFPFDPNFIEEAPKVIYSNVSGGLGVFGGIDYEYLRFDHKGNSWDEKALNVGTIQPCVQ